MAFFKKEQTEEAPVQPVRPRGDGAESGAQRSGPSVIGRNLKITGEITGDEDLLVDGRVEGKVDIGKTLTIGQSGQVNAEIHGETVMVLGRVNGNISAGQRVVLKPSANVTGNIHCVSFIVNEGASFEGNINMTQPERKTPEKKTPPAAAAAEPAKPAKSGDSK